MNDCYAAKNELRNFSYKTKRKTNQIIEASNKISTVKKAYVPRKIIVTDH